ncbi:MAG: hypothetical protein KF784_14895 [Fimbriimonadaceae bacterium]|nr:hypothetical protein [Fimbriimonadaceae bacterium]
MYDDAKDARRYLAYLLAAIAGLFLLHEFLRELNPLSGFWIVASGVDQDGHAVDMDGSRIFLDIDDGYASIASYWTCGAKRDHFAEGVMEVRNDEITLWNESFITHERDTVPTGKLKRLPGGRLSYTVYYEKGESLQIEFEREANAESVFDLLCWR